MNDEGLYPEVFAGPVALELVSHAFSKGSLEQMCDSGLFVGLSKGNCKEILSCCRSKMFRRHEMLHVQGSPMERMVLLQSGRVKVTQSSSDGNEVILWIIGAGETADASIEPSGRCHTSSAIAMENCESLVWDFRRFQALGARFPQIRANLCGILTTRLQELELRFSELATDKASHRLVMALLRLVSCTNCGKHCEQGCAIKLNLSREELGQLTGLTVFTISRLFSAWAADGMIKPGRESVIIHNVNQLRTLATANMQLRESTGA